MADSTTVLERRIVEQPIGTRVLVDRPEEPGSYRSGPTTSRAVIQRRWINIGMVPAPIVSVVLGTGAYLFWRQILEQGYEALVVIPCVVLTLMTLLITYAVIAGFVNRTRFIVQGGRLSVRHGPMPIWQKRDADGDVVELQAIETVARGGRRFALNAQTRTGTTLVLVDDALEADDVLFLQSFLEPRLGLVPARARIEATDATSDAADDEDDLDEARERKKS